MIDSAVVLIHPLSPGVDDSGGLQAGDKTECQIDVRPLVLAVGGPGPHDRRSPDALIDPRGRDKAFAEVTPFPLAEHTPDRIGSATHPTAAPNYADARDAHDPETPLRPAPYDRLSTMSA